MWCPTKFVLLCTGFMGHPRFLHDRMLTVQLRQFAGAARCGHQWLLKPLCGYLGSVMRGTAQLYSHTNAVQKHHWRPKTPSGFQNASELESRPKIRLLDVPRVRILAKFHAWFGSQSWIMLNPWSSELVPELLQIAFAEILWWNLWKLDKSQPFVVTCRTLW